MPHQHQTSTASAWGGWLRYSVAIGLLHLIVALAFKDILGITIQENKAIDWNYFWQTLPLELLQTDAMRSIWHLHAQPPLFNLYGA
ncbi:MAG: hypothetical protein AAF629_13650, partial [Chloroflexota bacterium]